MRDANFLARGVQAGAAFPVQPVRAGITAVVTPTLALIELGNEFKQATTCRIKMRGEFADSAAQSAGCKHRNSPH
jgi:hypothetical protein